VNFKSFFKKTVPADDINEIKDNVSTYRVSDTFLRTLFFKVHFVIMSN